MATKNIRILFFVPNLIGYVRLCLILAAFWQLTLQCHGCFVLLYAASIILDGVDGSIARRLNQCSQFGAWLDVVVDNLSRTLLWAHVHPMSSVLSSLEWTVFVCNHQLGEDWRSKVAASSNMNSVPAGSKEPVSDQCVAAARDKLSMQQREPDAICRAMDAVPEGEYQTRDGTACRQSTDISSQIRHRSNPPADGEREHLVALTSQDGGGQGVTSLQDGGGVASSIENGSINQQPPKLVAWIMKHNFRSVGGVWAIAGLHVLPLWLAGIKYDVFSTSLWFLPHWLPPLGILVLGAGRALCAVAEMWCVWQHVSTMITE